MKQIVTIVIFAFSLLNCKAQSPIIAIETDSRIGMPENSYYKDTNNVLNDFEGTWLYTDGNTSLKITLVKSTMFNNGDYYEDIMVGGYQYIEDGIEKINTLSDASIPNIGYNASIKGNNIYNNCSILPVDDCVDGEKRLDLSLKDVITEEHFASLILHKRTISGQDVLKARFENSCDMVLSEGETVPEPTLPWQMHNIILIKQ